MALGYGNVMAIVVVFEPHVSTNSMERVWNGSGRKEAVYPRGLWWIKHSGPDKKFVWQRINDAEGDIR